MRRFASVLALLGCFVHALLLPWHAAARMPAQLEAQQLAQDLLVICHGAGGSGELPAVPGSSDPTECPICKGIMGCQLMVLAAAELGLLERPVERIALVPSHEIGRSHFKLQPRSRGPPASSELSA
ncbi:MAG: hypothetical protein EKK41_06925 [Hyphomicrobiales bacterium]|nr:MAG: hypothetical protein EKK41_06925 [Hyphomicrobiales bacterium]